MSIEYRDIMQCEQLNELPDGAYVVVIDNGDMKIISKENAKFGGGTITAYYLVPDNTEPRSVDNGVAVQAGRADLKLQKDDGTEPTIQEVYDALNNGAVILKLDEDGYGRVILNYPVLSYVVNYTDGAPVYLELETYNPNIVVKIGQTIVN